MDTRVDRRTGLAVYTATGPIGREEVIAGIERMYADPDFRPGLNALWDFRGASLWAMTGEDIRAIIDFVAENRDRRGSGRAALLGPEDLTYGMMRMAQSLGEGKLDVSMRVFRDLDEAMDWVLPEEEGPP